MITIIWVLVIGFLMIRILELIDHWSRGDFSAGEVFLVSFMITVFYCCGGIVLTLLLA